MSSTTSLKLPDALKATIAKVAAFEGQTAHALARQQFYADGEASCQAALQTNVVFAGADVKAYVLARVAGGKPGRPKALPLDATKPMKPVHDRPARRISNRLLVLALRHQRESGYRP
jgi:hypothetical protein